NLADALSGARTALARARDAGLRAAECEALTVIAEALLDGGDVAAAEESFTAAYALAAASRLPAQRGRAGEGLGEIARRRGDLPAARRHLQQARDAYPVEAVERTRVSHALAALAEPPSGASGEPTGERVSAADR
ncbi:MAG TPA: hypothetical protein VHA75_16675, partial [Rugosimonospora sp.]|nr:hypothetical protein [Rugosimonospora sp.]